MIHITTTRPDGSTHMGVSYVLHSMEEALFFFQPGWWAPKPNEETQSPKVSNFTLRVMKAFKQ